MHDNAVKPMTAAELRALRTRLVDESTKFHRDLYQQALLYRNPRDVLRDTRYGGYTPMIALMAACVITNEAEPVRVLAQLDVLILRAEEIEAARATIEASAGDVPRLLGEILAELKALRGSTTEGR